MGNVEDVRKVFQDLIAPDLKALAARLEALEKEMKVQFVHVDQRFDHAEKMELERFSGAEKLASARHETVMATMAANQASIMNILDMDKRLSRLESERKAEAQHA